MDPARRLRRPTLRLPAAVVLLVAPVALGVVTVPAAGAAPPPAAAAVAGPAAAAGDLRPRPPRFRDCGRARCARVTAPLDHDRLDGPTIELFVTQVPARRPAARIGTLFVNPGGPGGSAADFARFAGQVLGRGVRDRFDIVGVDPRGVGRTAPARCRGRSDVGYPEVAYPRTTRQRDQWLAFDAAERRLCRGTRILDHMSTADTARDMDWVRRALGEDTLTFFGASYGSVLGATYGALFPDRVRAMVVDGVLDPVEWTTGRRDASSGPLPVTTRLGSDQGSREELAVGLALCEQAGRRECRLGRDALARWDTVAGRLLANPGAGDRIELSYDDFLRITQGSLYAGDLAGIARLTEEAERALARLDTRPAPRRGVGPGAPDDLAAARRAAETAAGASPFPGPYGAARGRRRTSLDGAFHGVLCADSVNPATTDAWPPAAAASFSRYRDFGPLWTWSSSACVGWPGSSADAYRGPFSGPDPDRVLVVNNQYDPATPLSGARALSEQLGGAPLLTVTGGFGHVATGTDDCATEQVRRALVTGRSTGLDLGCTAPPLFGD